MIANSGRSMLRLSAPDLLQELASQTRGIPLRLVSRTNVPATETDGWSCNIGSLRRGRPRLELWFDHYADRHVRRFWFGFYSPNRKEIDRLIVRAPLFLRPKRRQIFSDDIERTKQNNRHLQKPLSKSEFGLTFHEQYDNTSHY